MKDSGEWLTFDQAARLIGCSRGTVSKMATKRRFERRDTSTHWVPSLGRKSVEEVAIEWRTQQQAKRRASRARQRAKADYYMPPDDEHVWLSMGAASAMLGCTRNRVSQLAQAERLPYTRKGRRLWFRREHIEIFVAARVFQVQQTSSVNPGHEENVVA